MHLCKVVVNNNKNNNNKKKSHPSKFRVFNTPIYYLSKQPFAKCTSAHRLFIFKSRFFIFFVFMNKTHTIAGNQTGFYHFSMQKKSVDRAKRIFYSVLCVSTLSPVLDNANIAFLQFVISFNILTKLPVY